MLLLYILYHNILENGFQVNNRFPVIPPLLIVALAASVLIPSSSRAISEQQVLPTGVRPAFHSTTVAWWKLPRGDATTSLVRRSRLTPQTKRDRFRTLTFPLYHIWLRLDFDFYSKPRQFLRSYLCSQIDRSSARPLAKDNYREFVKKLLRFDKPCDFNEYISNSIEINSFFQIIII